MAEITSHQACYYAHELTRLGTVGELERLGSTLYDAKVDLNPHQIEAALFALSNPLQKGVILADEVGLGKTIEAGLVLCQKWAERKRRLIIVSPAHIRKQWQAELSEKFNLPSVVMDRKIWNQHKREGHINPFDCGKIIVVSYGFAARMQDELRATPFDLVVFDEAHKLRNAYVYDGGILKYVLSSSATGKKVMARHLYGAGQALVEDRATTPGGSLPTRWLFTDHLGTVREAQNMIGQVVKSLDYDAYGNITSETGSGAAPRLRYTGQLYDEDTGLYDYKARWYDSSIGRFLNPDPIEEGTNHFIYVGNDPLNYTDPTGLSRSASSWTNPFSTNGSTNYGSSFMPGANAAPRQDARASTNQAICNAMCGIQAPSAEQWRDIQRSRAPRYGTSSGDGFLDSYSESLGNLANGFLGQVSSSASAFGNLFNDAFVQPNIATYQYLNGSSSRYEFDAAIDQQRMAGLNIGAAPIDGVIGLYQTGNGFSQSLIDGNYDQAAGHALNISSIFALEAVGLRGTRANTSGGLLRENSGWAGFGSRGIERDYLSASGDIELLRIDLAPGTKTNVPRRLTNTELVDISRAAGNREVALIYRTGPGRNGGGGQYQLIAGKTASTRIPIASDVRLIAHTHPSGTANPSRADLFTLSDLQQVGSPQRSSLILPFGNSGSVFEPFRFNINTPLSP